MKEIPIAIEEEKKVQKPSTEYFALRQGNSYTCSVIKWDIISYDDSSQTSCKPFISRVEYLHSRKYRSLIGMKLRISRSLLN